ncbi:flagellar filament capping protein FliD [Xanthomonas campestris pv. phormiicola]|nr:flagellar filament capping protein FliD [Xanthomonas campestris pv. phormiicola]UYC17872.1 flagellar filament capping protein FliD [Xanthomonas campestris pv. phormiicola]
MEISDASYPTTMAKMYATRSTQGLDALLANKQDQAKKTSDALSTLRDALQTFQDSLMTLASDGKTVLAYTATSSDSSAATASATGNATAGSYAFYVEQLARNDQLTSLAIPADVAAAGAGSLSIKLADGSIVNVDLSGADASGDGSLSAAELARAINQASGGKVNASTMTINGEQRLVINSAVDGADGKLSLDTSAVADANLASALSGANETAIAANAVFHIGGKDGTRVEQGSNTFAGIDGLKVTFLSAAATFSIDVARDDTATIKNVQDFVDANNKLSSALDDLTRVGDPAKGDAGGVLANDAGIAALRQRLNTLLHLTQNGQSLPTLGITSARDGQLVLDSSRLTAMLKTDPGAIGRVLGDGTSGITGALNTYLPIWLEASHGLLKSRDDSAQKVQEELNKNQKELSDKYDQFYQRYLAQFTNVQTLSSKMEYTMALLDSMTSKD